MADYLFLMRDDATTDQSGWEPYLSKLRQDGVLQGGSAIGDGACERKGSVPAALTSQACGLRSRESRQP
jgi:hypothetical protein